MFNMIPISVALLSQRRQVWENPQTLNQDEIKEAVLPSSSTQQLHASKENTSGLSETHPCCDVMSCVPGFPNLFGWTLTAVQCLDLSAGWHNSFCLLRALYLLEASLRTWNMSATHDREFRVKTVEASFSVMNEGDVISRHASVSIMQPRVVFITLPTGWLLMMFIALIASCETACPLCLGNIRGIYTYIWEDTILHYSCASSVLSVSSLCLMLSFSVCTEETCSLLPWQPETLYKASKQSLLLSHRWD